MGEIKSTLDLVMERTRHLTLSEEEKSAQNRSAYQKKLGGVIQKFLDGALRPEEVGRELSGIEADFAAGHRTVFLTAVLDRLDPDRPPEPLLYLVRFLFKMDTTGLETAFDHYGNEKTSAAETVRAALEHDLASTRRISGNAVTVNLETRTGWLAEAERLRQAFTTRLEAEKRRLLDAL
jgi:hypothetical protein